jgi:hypothetical protein
MWQEGVGTGCGKKEWCGKELPIKNYRAGSFIYILEDGVEGGDLRASIKYRLELKPCRIKFFYLYIIIKRQKFSPPDFGLV